jgi:ribonuclease HII
MPVRRQLRAFDLKQILGHDSLIGVDEAGRGAFAGPVVAGAVMVTRGFLEGRWAQTRSSRVNDSKQLSPSEREEVFSEMEELAGAGSLHASVGCATAAEIGELNILGATKLAMRRALEAMYPPESFQRHVEPDLFSSLEARSNFRPTVNSRILVDGLPLKCFPYPHTALVKGDGKSLCIAMASIVAKVTRDRMMNELDPLYPSYGFSRHKGYGTEEHRSALLQHGRCPEHREAFLRKLMAIRSDPSQLTWLADEEG